MCYTTLRLYQDVMWLSANIKKKQKNAVQHLFGNAIPFSLFDLVMVMNGCGRTTSGLLHSLRFLQRQLHNVPLRQIEGQTVEI